MEDIPKKKKLTKKDDSDGEEQLSAAEIRDKMLAL